MGPEDLDGYMALTAENAQPSDTKDHGLRFTNDEWNGSISNGEPFTLRWNESIDNEYGDLRLFRIRYPEDGVIAFEPVSNLTESMDEMECIWTPEDLSPDDLYALWVTREDRADPRYAISPPWKPKEQESSRGFHWTNPIGIPIVVILGVYFISLATCLMYRRSVSKKRERERRRQEAVSDAPPMPDNADRHPSVGSVATVQTLTEEDELVKKHDEGRTGIVTNPPPPVSNHGVQWNRMVWRSEARPECGDEPVMRDGEWTWEGAWDEGPIGQAR